MNFFIYASSSSPKEYNNANTYVPHYRNSSVLDDSTEHESKRYKNCMKKKENVTNKQGGVKKKKTNKQTYKKVQKSKITDETKKKKNK